MSGWGREPLGSPTIAAESATAALVERAQAGDGDAFAALYDQYVDSVYGYVQRRVHDAAVAEDLTSDVFLRALRRISTFRWQGVDIGAWLMTIARNRVHDHFKSARHRFESTTSAPADIQPSHDVEDPEGVAVARDMARSLAAALERLSPDHREVIELRFVHGLSVADTAAVMDRTGGAVKALQYRACRSLAEIIRDEPGMHHLATIGLSGVLQLLRLMVTA